MSARSSEPTGWVGWIYFASFMMMLVGIFQAIAGLVALFKDDFYLVTSNHLIAFSFTTWGWIDLILGIIVFLAGVALMAGAMWARIIAVLMASLSLFANMAFLNAYPWWSTLMIVLDILVIYAVTVHGGEVQE